MQLVQGNLTQLRTGCLSEILLVQRGDLQLVLKTVESKATKQVSHLLNEWTVLNQIQHPNVVDVYNCFKKVTIPGKEGVRKAWKSFLAHKEETDNDDFSQPQIFVLGISKSHITSSQDLKLDNILVFQNQQGLTLKIADFGFAKILTESGEMIGSYKGTKRGYMAPEIHECKDDTSKRYDGKAADMFALGVILFALVLGRLPFQFATPEDRNYKLLLRDDPSEFWANLIPILVKLQQTQDAMISDFKDLFVSLVKYNSKQRLTIGQVLQHEWLLGKKQRLSL